MHEAYEAFRRRTAEDGARIAFSDEQLSLSREELLARVNALAQALVSRTNVMGILASNSVHWAVAQLAGAVAGKIVVPLPPFFSSEQLGHIIRDANIDLILASDNLQPLIAHSGIAALSIADRRPASAFELIAGFSQIIYTSGSTGNPKGVRLGGGQIGWSANALAAATSASESDSYLSVLPLPLLLETICAIFVPLLVGGKTHLVDTATRAFGAEQMHGLAAMFETTKPTSSVLVPQLLGAWLEELTATGRRAPATLRFVAVGGAPVPGPLVEKAWALGIPVHEGYGLSECCSVVALNRTDSRKAGTVGQPLAGLRVSIEEQEIVVEGPSVMDGYLGRDDVARRWHTGDLGSIDADGYLTVHGRKDNLLVTSFGRNVSPEWIETMLLGDRRIAFCAVLGHGEPHLTALLVPSITGSVWFTKAEHADILDLIALCCVHAPSYAVPKDFAVLPLPEAMRLELITPNGRFRRLKAMEHFRKANASTT
jgi:long-subunit acyl-CoA synthetase (AMP-forming)